MASWLQSGDDPNRTLRFAVPLKNLLLRGKKVRDDKAKTMTIGEAYAPASEYPNHILFGFEPAEEGFQFPMYFVPGSEMVSQSMDPETGTLRTVTQTIVANGTAAVATNNNGSYSEVQSQDPNWMIQSVRQAAGLAGDAVNGKATREMPMPRRHYWPPVLAGIYTRPVYTNPADIYSPVTGFITYPIWRAYGFNGGCKGTMTEMWTKVKPSFTGDPSWPDSGSAPYIPEPTKLLPRPISFQGTSGFNISVESCLHPAFTFWNEGFVMHEPATEPVIWPGTIILDVSVQAYLGGYLSRWVTINAPSTLDTGLNLDWVGVSNTSVKVTWDTGGSGTLLDVSTSPDFTRGMLLSGQAVPSSGTLEYTVTGMTRGQIYFARLRRSALSSNIVQFQAEPQSELALYDDTTPVTTALAFADTPVGVANVKTLTLRNTGFLSLESLAAALSGTNSAEFTVGTLPASVASLGGEDDFTLTWTPSATGSRTATLTLASDDPDSPLVVALSGTSTDPEINVKYSGTDYADGSTIAFGSVNTGSSQDFTITIENTGTGVLTVSAAVGAGDWQLTSEPAGTVAAAGSTTLQVTFSPTAGGTRTATLTIENTDRDEDPYEITLSGTGVAVGEIEVQDPLGNILVDAGSSYDFGTVDAGGSSSRTKTFTIYNRGAGTLASLAVSKSGTNSADFTLGSLATSVAGGSNTTFTIAFDPGSTGARVATISIASDDADENPFTFDVGGTGGTGPDIQVEQPAPTVIADDGTVDFGPVLLTGGTAVKVFTIRNLGTSDLTVTAVSMTAGHTSDFAVSGISLPATVAADSTTTFSVTFNATALGPRSATLRLVSNPSTGTKTNYDITLTGAGIPEDALVTYQSAAVVIGQADMDDQSTSSSSVVTAGKNWHAAISPAGKLALADHDGSRVLIYNTVPVANGTAADVILATSSPVGVAWSGEDLLVSQLYNHRVLRYAAPVTASSTPANVIGQPNLATTSAGTTAAKLRAPRGLLVTSSGKLVICDYANNRALIYNTVPTTNGVSANVVVGQSSFTSAVGGSAANKLESPSGVAEGPDGKLYIAEEGNNRVTVFSAVPTSNNASAAFVLLQSGFGSTTAGAGQVYCQGPNDVAVSADGVVAVADNRNHRVVLFYEVPTTSGASAHAVLGQPNFNVNSAWAGGSAGPQNMRLPTGLVWHGTHLLVSGDMKRALIFQPA